jgi:hypothetical protein
MSTSTFCLLHSVVELLCRPQHSWLMMSVFLSLKCFSYLLTLLAPMYDEVTQCLQQSCSLSQGIQSLHIGMFPLSQWIAEKLEVCMHQTCIHVADNRCHYWYHTMWSTIYSTHMCNLTVLMTCGMALAYMNRFLSGRCGGVCKYISWMKQDHREDTDSSTKASTSLVHKLFFIFFRSVYWNNCTPTG